MTHVKILKDVTSRIFTLIIRSDGKYCELLDALALLFVGTYFAVLRSFGLPIWAGVAFCVLSVGQAASVAYNYRLGRTICAGVAFTAWIMLIVWTVMVDRRALGIPFSAVFAIGSLLTYMFQNSGGGIARGL